MNQVLVNTDALNALLAAAGENFRLIGLVNEVRSSVRALPTRLMPAEPKMGSLPIKYSHAFLGVTTEAEGTINPPVVLETDFTDAGTVTRATRRIRSTPNPETAE
jgi:hypothetical protein